MTERVDTEQGEYFLKNDLASGTHHEWVDDWKGWKGVRGDGLIFKITGFEDNCTFNVKPWRWYDSVWAWLRRYVIWR